MIITFTIDTEYKNIKDAEEYVTKMNKQLYDNNKILNCDIEYFTKGLI